MLPGKESALHEDLLSRTSSAASPGRFLSESPVYPQGLRAGASVYANAQTLQWRGREAAWRIEGVRCGFGRSADQEDRAQRTTATVVRTRPDGVSEIPHVDWHAVCFYRKLQRRRKGQQTRTPSRGIA